MNSFFLRHIEKLLFLVILVACGYWVSSSVATMSASPGDDRGLKEAVASIEGKLNGSATWEKEVGPFLERVRKTRNPSVEPEPVPHHVFNWLPPRGGGVGDPYLEGVLGPPEEVTASARRGRIDIKWSLTDAVGCIPYQFELYRRKQGEEDFPERPYATVKADWPEPKFLTEETAFPSLHKPPGPGTPGEAEEAEKSIKQDYEYTDNNVDAKTTYYYRVRVWAEEFTKEQIRNGGWKGLIRPDNMTVVERDGKIYWITGYSGMAEARTPSNIRLVYKGAVGNPPHWRARVTVKEWKADLDKWLEAGALTVLNDRIVGEATVNIRGRTQRVKIDSGYVLTRIIRETRYRIIEQKVMGETREVEIPYLYNAIEVRDAETGQTRLIVAGKEQEEEEDISPAPEEAEEEEEATDTGGGRRRGPID